MQVTQQVKIARVTQNARARSAPEVLSNSVAMSEITGLPRWLCRNVLIWRFKRGLSIQIAKAV